MRRTARTAALALGAAAIAVGCGTSPLSPSALRQQAGAICSRADRQIGRIAAPSSQAAGNPFLKKGVAALDPELAQLKGLVPPADDSVVYQSAIKSLSGELDALQAATDKLDRGADPVATFRGLQAQLAPLEADADNAWRALDIPACFSR